MREIVGIVWAVIAITSFMMGCPSSESASGASAGLDEPRPSMPTGSTPDASAKESSMTMASGPVIVQASLGSQSLAAYVAAEQRRVVAAGGRLLVYVGASWCEPCKRFHDAVVAGKLEGHFMGLTLLEFDRDQHGTALDEAGYRSRLIPLFALAQADGRASGRQIEGSIKGAGAVANIVPRLRSLLGKTAAP